MSTDANFYPFFPPGTSQPTIVRGAGSKVTDTTGKTYVDLEAGPGVSSVGHCHPRVVDAVSSQAANLIHSPGRYFSELAVTLVDRLSALTGHRLKRAFFSNSGAEANDVAIKLSMKHASRSSREGYGIIALEHGFHGRLSLALSLTGLASRKRGFGPYATFPGIVHAPAPYCYRCPFDLEPSSCGAKCAEAIEESFLTKIPGEVVVMIAEPILAVGGVLVAPDAYWDKIQDICDRHDIALIHDEVFTGFGRTGRMFAHEFLSTTPRIITFAKAIAGGVPLGGALADEEISEAFVQDDHFTTFGMNNQLGLAAAHAVLDVLEEEQLAQQAARKGDAFLAGLRQLQEKHERVGDVRGQGLMVGIEFVVDRTTKQPDPDLARQVKKQLAERGFLVSLTGAYGCVMRFTPALVIDDAELEETVQCIDQILTGL